MPSLQTRYVAESETSWYDDAMSANSTLEIQEFVEQQHGGPVHLTGTDIVVMSVDVYCEIMGVGTDAELQASLQGIHAGWKAVEEGEFDRSVRR